MHNEEKKPQRRGPGGPGHGMVGEKAKDFKSAIKRLFKELKPFHVLIFVALVLAALGSVLALFSPNKLSDLTDKISGGLVINKDNFTKITDNMKANLNEEVLKEKLPIILAPDLSEKNIKNILSSNEISNEDKLKFQELLMGLQNGSIDSNNLLKEIPSSIMPFILKDSNYNGITVTYLDKVSLINMFSSEENTDKIFPESIGRIFFKDFTIDDITVTVDDQVKFITSLNEIDYNNGTELYRQIDSAPESIKTLLEPNMDMKGIWNLTLFLIILYIISAIFTYIESLAMTDVSNKFALSLRDKISKKINLLPLTYFDNHAIGDTLSRVTNDVDTIAQSMNQSLSSLVSAITLFVGSIIMMFYTNSIMAITAILSSLFGFIFMFGILGKSQKYFTARQEELGNLNGHIEEIYSGLNVVKVYNGKEESDIKFDEYNKKVYDANRKSQFLSGLMMPMMNFIGNFGYVAVCIVGALLTLNGKISFGVIVAFISYVRLFTSPLSQIAQAMTSLQSTAAASERVYEFLDEKEMPKENTNKVLKKKDVKGKIEFKDVVFKYDGNDKPTINGFSATALPGQKVAIVGPTGAGKTTMVNLLMKFYDINSGDILIDDISTKELTRNNVHELFTMVLQDTWLFEGTVRENIKYNRKNVSDTRVKEVCKIVGIDHFIKSLPNGYDSVITDNDSVSAGQRQLLTIARGMIEDAPFLILDEATSNVDTRTEELVQAAMDKLMEGRTSFIIAHRLSTIKNADLILVMKDGNIIEQGNHDELMAKNGFYAELYNSQFEL